MRTRKKKILDGIDKEIMRVLLIKSPLVSRKIAKYVGVTPAAITPRLNNLQKKGIIKKSESSVIRSFNIQNKNSVIKIKSPRYIKWGLDIKN